MEQGKKTSTRRAFVKRSANAAGAAVVGPMVLRAMELLGVNEPSSLQAHSSAPAGRKAPQLTKLSHPKLTISLRCRAIESSPKRMISASSMDS